MAQQEIFLGTVANDGTGTPNRAAFEMINENFAELYARGPPWFGEEPPADTDTYPFWWDTSTGVLRVFYPNDGDPVWVDATPSTPGPEGPAGADGDDGATGATGSTGPAAWSAPTAWLTATAYTVGPPASVVTQGGETYVCLISHTSGTFATDLAAVKWAKVAAKGADGAGVAITAKEEGSNLTTAMASINFVGGGATATNSTNDVTVTVRDYYVQRVMSHSTSGSDVSVATTTTYSTNGNLAFFLDLDTFVPTHFRIVVVNGAPSAGTITAQLAPLAAVTTPVHTGGDDLAMSGAAASRDSGWRTWDNPGGLTALQLLQVTLKASSGTPNLTFRSIDVHFKR